MPTVPRLTPSVAPAPIPGARRRATLTPLAAGVGLAQEQQQLGATVAQTGTTLGIAAARLRAAQEEAKERARAEADQLAAVRLQNEADKFRREKVYHPQTGYLATMGENALGLPETAQADLQKFLGEIAPGVTTPRQQLAWERISADLQDRTMLEVYRHTEGQGKAVMIKELEASEQNAVQMAGVAANDPDRVAIEIGHGEGAVDQLAKYTGMGTTEREARKRKLRTDAHANVINTLLSREQTTKAREYLAELEENPAGIDSEAMDDMRRAVRAGSVKAEAQIQSDKIVDQGGTLQEQRDQAKKIQDPDVRDATLNYIEHEHDIKRAAERERVEGRDKRLADLLDKRPSFNAIPIADLRDMTSAERGHWRAYIANILESSGANGVGTGFAKHDDPETWLYLTELARTNPVKFSQINWWDPKLRTKLTGSTFKQFFESRGSAAKGDQAALEEALQGPFTFNNIWSTMIKQAGLKDDNPVVGQIMDSVMREGRLEAIDPNTGKVKKLTSDDWTRIIRRNLMSVSVDKPWYTGGDLSLRGAQLQFEHIPASELPLIKDAINRAHPNNPVTSNTDQRILTTYRNQLLLKQQQGK